MTSQPLIRRQRWAAVAGAAFGLATLLAGGSVLFGPPDAGAVAGDIVPFVVWFNFLAGFAYLAAAAGLWTGQRWARPLAWGIVAATAAVALAFAWVVFGGARFEPRTIGALVFRTLFWAALALIVAPRPRS